MAQTSRTLRDTPLSYLGIPGQFCETHPLAPCTAPIHLWIPGASSLCPKIHQAREGARALPLKASSPTWPILAHGVGGQQENPSQTFYWMFPFLSPEASPWCTRPGKSLHPPCCPHRSTLGLARKSRPSWESMPTLIYREINTIPDILV